MMPALKRHAERDPTPHEDHIVVLRDVSWADYERILSIRGENRQPRIAYHAGLLEIMSTSYDHEKIGSCIARLVEAYCLDEDLEFTPVGSWTLKDEALERGAEPDECYVFGPVSGPSRPTRPDLAIEVIWTSGGVNKLDIYAGLGVAEVWFWDRGAIQVHVLRAGHYRKAARSKALPGLDLELLCQFLDRQSTSQAIRDFRKALAAKRR